MQYTRRDLSLLLPAFAAAAGANAQSDILPSKAYPFEEIPVKTNGENRQRNVLNGKTHDNFPVEVHLTELPPGGSPHPPHHHAYEEMILVKDGTMEVTISGKSSKLGPGSAAYVASGEEHGWRNAGDTRALYFIVTLGRA